jgi:four helix bundle protein
MEKFKKLKVWLKAHQLVLEVYRITERFPKDERFGLISQMRRAPISVVANIVEGTKRNTLKDRKHFHTMADTSLEELKYYFLLSYELGYITQSKGENVTEHAREIGRMLNALTKKL